MKSAVEIRNQYGFSLSQMAGYLGISKSLLAMVEHGKRSLPLEAYKKLATLGLNYQAIAEDASAKPAIPVARQVAMRKEIKKILGKTTNRLRLVKEKLERLNDMNTSLQLEAASIAKLARVEKKQIVQTKSKYLEIRIFETNKRTGAYNQLERSLLDIKMRLLEVEIGMLEELLRMPRRKL